MMNTTPLNGATYAGEQYCHIRLSRSCVLCATLIKCLGLLTRVFFSTVVMIDIDRPKGSTLLSWLQTGVTVEAVSANPTLSMVVPGNASAPYIPPNPPAQAPLTHRYVQLLLDATGMAATTRQGFSTQDVLSVAGLTADKIVGGNFFTVTNGR